MQLTLGLLVVVALLGANGARLWNEDDFAGTPPVAGTPPIEGTPPYDDFAGTPPKERIDDVDGTPPSMINLGKFEVDRLNEIGSDDVLVDMDNFNMSIFPRLEDMDESAFLDEKDTNLTGGSCSMSFQMPCRGGFCGAQGTRWVKFSSKACIYATTCRSSSHGDVPGFYWGGRCYFEYGHRLWYTHQWTWVGVIGSGYRGSHNSYTCNIFGGYQKGFPRPLFHCLGCYHGWLIPGKLDINSRTCWYLNTHSTSFYSIVAR